MCAADESDGPAKSIRPDLKDITIVIWDSSKSSEKLPEFKSASSNEIVNIQHGKLLLRVGQGLELDLFFVPEPQKYDDKSFHNLDRFELKPFELSPNLLTNFGSPPAGPALNPSDFGGSTPIPPFPAEPSPRQRPKRGKGIPAQPVLPVPPQVLSRLYRNNSSLPSKPTPVSTSIPEPIFGSTEIINSLKRELILAKKEIQAQKETLSALGKLQSERSANADIELPPAVARADSGMVLSDENIGKQKAYSQDHMIHLLNKYQKQMDDILTMAMVTETDRFKTKMEYIQLKRAMAGLRLQNTQTKGGVDTFSVLQEFESLKVDYPEISEDVEKSVKEITNLKSKTVCVSRVVDLIRRAFDKVTEYCHEARGPRGESASKAFRVKREVEDLRERIGILEGERSTLMETQQALSRQLGYRRLVNEEQKGIFQEYEKMQDTREQYLAQRLENVEHCLMILQSKSSTRKCFVGDCPDRFKNDRDLQAHILALHVRGNGIFAVKQEAAVL